MTKLSIIVINWNTGKLLSRCLHAIDSLGPDEASLINHVVVVDNDSWDSSFSDAQNATYSVPMYFKGMTENLGFAAANNYGIDWTLHEHGQDQHILLLNPDTEIKPGALLNMLSVLDRHPKVGIVGPKLVQPGGTTQASVRKFPTLTTFITIFLKLHRLFPNVMPEFTYDTEQVVDQVEGAAFLIRNKTLQDIGPLDAGYWIWFEEDG